MSAKSTFKIRFESSIDIPTVQDRLLQNGFKVVEVGKKGEQTYGITVRNDYYMEESRYIMNLIRSCTLVAQIWSVP